MNTALVLALTLAASGAQATTPADSRFDGWLGCWRLEDDLSGTGVRMCITPEAGGVRLQTVAGDRRGIDEVVIPDGAARPIADRECKGSERSEWSKDGMRVFRTTEITCQGEAPRSIKSVAFLGPGPSWTYVQHLTGADGSHVRTQRYRRAFNQNLADGTKAAQPRGSITIAADAAAWSVDDVIEASAKLPAEVLQAALVDARQGFDLNRKTLVQLAEANVREDVIDLMVALTFPKRFVVEQAGSGGSAIGVSTGMGWYDPFMSPMYSGAYANCYMMGGYYGYRSYYNLCGYYYPGYSGYYPYYNSGGWIPINPSPGPGPITPTAEGRVVNGRGYTRIRERSPEPVPARINSRGDGTAAGWSGNSGSGSGSSGVSSQGYSGGSSSGASSGGDSGARVAVPRPPGE